MKRRRRRFLLGALASGMTGIAVACTFPEVTFGPALSEGGVPASETEGGLEDSSIEDGGLEDSSIEDGDLADGIVFGDGDVGDVVTSRGDASAIDAAACSDVCDCDSDGYVRDGGCDGDAGDAGGKPTGDCDDTDPLRNPRSGYVAVKPTSHTGDWNCDGVVEKGYPEGNRACTGTPLTGCAGEGFEKPVACGEEADYFKCGAAGLWCQPNIFIDRRRQACK